MGEWVKENTDFFLLLNIFSKGYNRRYIQLLSYANKEAKASRRIGIFPGSPRDSVRRRVWSPGFCGGWWEERCQRPSVG